MIGFSTPFRLYDIITESNYVTEKDLETLVPSTDLSGYYTKTESDEIFLKTDNFGLKLSTAFQNEMNIFGFNINFDTGTTGRFQTRSDIEIIGTNNEKVKFINCTPTDADGYPYLVDFSSKGSGTGYLTENEIRTAIQSQVIDKVLEEYRQYLSPETKFLINSSGKFTIWGSFSDSGCVGRKIVVDSYGGEGKVGGGCFSSKNATKVDRSGAYYARYVAKNIVAHNLASRCEIQLSYAIGLPSPISIYIECFDTNKVPMQDIYDFVKNNFNFSLSNIIDELDLLKPIYKQTACYCHFGRENFPWEKIKNIK